MNKVVLMGRLVRDPEVRYTAGENLAIARYTLAVDRRFKREHEASADFVSCVAFGRYGEFAEKYLKKGTKITISGRIQTGSYTNDRGDKVYTTDVVVEEQEFAESKNSGTKTGENGTAEAGTKNRGRSGSGTEQYKVDEDGFMNIPEGIEDELPFA